MMSLNLRRVAVTVGILLAGRAFAQPPPTEAERLFQQARDQMAQKHFGEACALFEQSHALEPALGALLNLADCYEQSGRIASAYLAFNEATAWAARNHEAKREDVASHRAEALKAKLTSLAVDLSTPVEHGEAQLWKPGGAAAFKTWSLDGPMQTIPVDAGSYELRIESQGFQKLTLPLDVRGTPGVQRVPVTLVQVSPPPPTPPMVDSTLLVPPPPPPAEEVVRAAPRTTPSGISKPGVALLVSGAVVFAAGAVGLVYSATISEAANLQQPGHPEFANPTVTRAQFNLIRVLYPTSWAVVTVGAVAAAIGVVFMVKGVGVSVAPNGVALNGTF
jgi:hypothetical protein